MKNKLNLFLGLASGAFLALYFFVQTQGYYGLLGRFINFCLVFFYNLFNSTSEFVYYSFLFFFFVGFTLTLLQIIRNLVFERKVFKNALKQDDFLKELSKELGLEGKVVVYKDNKPVAKVIGFFSPKIVLSSSFLKLLEEKELKAVLLHEKSHLKDKDNLSRIFFYFITYSTPFFLLLKPLFEWLKSSQELKADEYAFLRLKTKRPLYMAMKKLISKPGFGLLSSYSDSLDERLDSSVRAKVKIKVLFVLFVFVFVFLVSLPMQVSSKESENAFCIKGTECWNHCVFK